MKLTNLILVAAVSMTFGISVNAADRGKAYVSNQDGGVSVIDLNTLTSTANIDVKGGGPRGLAISDDGKLLIVATRENGSISVIDTATNEVVRQIPVGKNPEFVRVRGNFAFVSYEPSAKGGPPKPADAKPAEAMPGGRGSHVLDLHPGSAGGEPSGELLRAAISIAARRVAPFPLRNHPLTLTPSWPKPYDSRNYGGC